jgi:hypothetical protein
MSASFEAELTRLINRHSIENKVDMPDFLLARMLCAIINGIGPTIKTTLDWHGCSSVCHTRKELANNPDHPADRADFDDDELCGEMRDCGDK